MGFIEEPSHLGCKRYILIPSLCSYQIRMGQAYFLAEMIVQGIKALSALGWDEL